MQFDIIHDRGLRCCFIGNKGNINRELHRHFNANGVDAELVSVEYALAQPPEWAKSRQFFCALSGLDLKIHLVNNLNTDNWFSIVDRSCSFPFYDINQIGVNTLIMMQNSVLDSNNHIGSHCLLYGCVFSHAVRVEDYCVIAPNTYIAFYTVGEGCHIGVGSSIIGRLNRNNYIAEYSNITAHSRVSKDLRVTGTYINNRLLNGEGSLDRHIL